MLGREVTEDWLDSGAAFHPFPNSLGDRSPAAFIDDDRLGALMIITQLAHVHRAFFYGMDCDESSPWGELRIQGMSILGITQ
jgi:hypothetical protein